MNRADLATPHAGPCIVEEYDSTCVIPPGCTGSLDRFGNIAIAVSTDEFSVLAYVYTSPARARVGEAPGEGAGANQTLTRLASLGELSRKRERCTYHAYRTHKHRRKAMIGKLGISRRSVMELTALGPLAAVGFRGLRSAMAQSTGKTLTVAIPAGPTTLDPIIAVTHDPLTLTQTMFENLVEYDVDGVLRAAVGETIAGDLRRSARLYLRAARRRLFP